MSGFRDWEGAGGVVTGGASGIGRGIAEALIARGVRVVIADIEEDRCARTAAEIGADYIVTDVGDAASVEALAATALARLGAVHLVFNNAGVGPAAPVAEMTLADWRWMLGVNLWGVIHGIHFFLPLLRRNASGGHIVNTASLSGMASMPGRAGYAASKYGVVAITEALAAELTGEPVEGDGAVGASILFPGATRTAIGTAQRNRPAGSLGGLRDWEIKENQPLNGHAIPFLDPRQVGELALDGVERGTLRIQTHPEFLGLVEPRHRAIEASLVDGRAARAGIGIPVRE